MTKLTNTKPAGMEKVERVYLDRARRARELREAGSKIIGYFCCFAPVEFMTALGLVPYRILAKSGAETRHADAYLEDIMCSFVRSCFDQAMSGEYDFLDGLVVPHSCDTVERIYPIWKSYKSLNFTHFVNVPHMKRDSSKRFYRQELQNFKSSLEKFAGRQMSENDLRDAIQLHNENRGLLRKLYETRKGNPPLISGVETQKVLIAALSLPAAEANEMLRAVLDEVNSRHPRPGATGPRLLLYGSEIDDTAFIQTVEDAGAHVVVDDVCIGTKMFWSDVETTQDPMQGLVERYLEDSRCPRTYVPKAGSHEQDLENRFGHLRRYVQDYRVRGAILRILRFCDTFELDAPDVKEYLEKMGVMVLHIEDEHGVDSAGQLGTRVQAFVEMIT